MMKAVTKPMVVAVVAALLALGALTIVIIDSSGSQRGEQGSSGQPGPVGPAGSTGATGAAGSPGPTGRTGATGTSGLAGPAGPQGTRGATGKTGAKGSVGATGASGPVGDTGAQGCEGAAGPTGPQGNTGPQGCEGPVGATGATGDAGPAGSPGADGRTILSGTGAPKDTTGEDGDFYIDTASEDIYGPKTAGSWGAATSTIGPAGPQGEQGPAGTNGKTVLSGAGAPDPALGSDGDFYLDTSNNDFYGPKSGGSWGAGTSLVGPAGPQGEQGIAGANGRTILNGPGAPAADTGSDGDFYVDTAAEDIYGPKTGGAWGSPTSLVGPPGAKGDTGETGAAGKTILSGSGAPDAGLGTDGDFYIDTTALVIYGPKTGGGWGSPVSLVGPQGPQGDTGPAGEQGPKGDTGATGPGVPPAFGEFHSTGDQSPTAGGVTTPIVLSSTDESSGVTLDAPGSASITVSTAGTYNFQFSAQVTKTDAGTDILYLWPQLDTGTGWTSPTWSNSSINLTAANQRQIASWNFVFTVPAGTKFRMVMASTNTGFVIDTINPSPYGPEIPGLIVTANRVG